MRGGDVVGRGDGEVDGDDGEVDRGDGEVEGGDGDDGELDGGDGEVEGDDGDDGEVEEHVQASLTFCHRLQGSTSFFPPTQGVRPPASALNASLIFVTTFPVCSNFWRTSSPAVVKRFPIR